jgi:hypothetical protein
VSNIPGDNEFDSDNETFAATDFVGSRSEYTYSTYIELVAAGFTERQALFFLAACSVLDMDL